MPSRTDEEWRRTDMTGLDPTKFATLEHAKAWELAEAATEDLGRLVGGEERTVTLVSAAFRDLDRARPASLYQERDAERLRQRRLRS